MNVSISEDSSTIDSEWGSVYKLLTTAPLKKNIIICHVSVEDLTKIAQSLTQTIQNMSWMSKLDKGTKRQYEFTAIETASVLLEIFQNPITSDNKLSTEFGEIMISMGASRALCKMLGHFSIPIAELWKPQKKQNEGFDFHTVCKNNILNFGEAKYSGRVNPHYNASDQTDRFFEVEKHYRDRTALRDLVNSDAISNLDDDKFGAIIAFSMNSEDITKIINNAVEKAESYTKLDQAQNIYIVGVSCNV